MVTIIGPQWLFLLLDQVETAENLHMQAVVRASQDRTILPTRCILIKIKGLNTFQGVFSAYGRLTRSDVSFEEKTASILGALNPKEQSCYF